jgi:hypothetical protein
MKFGQVEECFHHVGASSVKLVKVACQKVFDNEPQLDIISHSLEAISTR